MRHVTLPLCITSLTLLLAGVGSHPAGQGTSPSLVARKDTIGDTIVVTTLSGSIWGDSVKLVEELRFGSTDADDPSSLRQPVQVVPTPDGTMYVKDYAGPSLLVFDSKGRYLRTVGRLGRGPGEYLDIGQFGLLRDGRLLLTDCRLPRLSVFSPSGKYLGELPSMRAMSACHLTFDSTGGANLFTYTRRRYSPRELEGGFVRLDSKGRIRDTLMAPPPYGSPAVTVFEPHSHREFHPFGFWMTAFSDRYSINVHAPKGPKVLRIVKKGDPTIPYTDAEREQLLNLKTAPGTSPPPPKYDIPSNKPPFSDFFATEDGRIWVKLASPRTLAKGRYHEPKRYDVFEPDGRYLGRLIFPEYARVGAARGNTVWGIDEDDDGGLYVVRWRIETPARRR
jgi:hypothetical protein